MNRTILAFFLIFSPFLKGQINLVPNPSFEQYDTCPNNLNQLTYADPWYSPNGNTPDLFNSCGGSVPQNTPGWQMPRTGSGYAGLAAYYYYYNGSNINLREYIAAPLIDTLITGKRYCIEFYASRSDSSFWAINRLGLHISATPIPNDGQGETINVIPQIQFDSNQIFLDDTTWVKVSGIFTAIGGERHIYIGNFYGDSQMDTLSHLGVVIAAYYYIDDVSVYELAECNAGNDVSICYEDSVPLGISSAPNVLYEWTPTVGLSNPNISNPVASPDTSITYILKQTECDAVIFDTVTVIINRDCHNASSISIPTVTISGQEFFISGLESNSQLDVYDIRGRLVYASEDYQNDFTFITEAQELYLTVLTRPNGEVICQKVVLVN